MKTKKEIIKEAYGKYFAELESDINMDTGACLAKPPEALVKKGISYTFSFADLGSYDRYCPWYPRGLKRKLDNNGWKPMKYFDPDPSDTTEIYEVYWPDEKQTTYIFSAYGRSDADIEFVKLNAELFRRIELEKPPYYVE